MKNPLVSVIMLAYNHKEYIEKAINSVLSQETVFQYELLIGEDCSIDGTREIVFDYQKRYPEIIRVITSDKNVGMNENSVRAIAAARGKYLAYCEGDDFWNSKDKLQKQVNVLESDQSITFCFHNVNFLYQGKSRPHKQFAWRFQDRYFSTKDVILGGGEFHKEVSAVMQRSVLENPPFWYSEAPVSDWATSLLSAFKGRLYYINEVMASYRSGVPQSWTEKMYNNPTLYKEHLFKSMRVRKLADAYSDHKYKKYFGRRIGRDVRWLIMFDELSDDEFSELEREYFDLLSPHDKLMILIMRTINIERFISFLRRIKKSLAS